jgi:hypothetical protein
LTGHQPECGSQNTVFFRGKYCFSLIPFSSSFASVK